MNRGRRNRDRVLRALVAGTAAIPVLLIVFLLITLVDSGFGLNVISRGDRSSDTATIDTVNDMISGIDAGTESPVVRGSWYIQMSVALAGSLWVVIPGLVLPFFPAMLTALWLTSMRPSSPVSVTIRWINTQIVRVPHVLYGVFALAVLSPTYARNVGGAVLTMGVLMLPRQIVMMEREILGIPAGIREAAFALGASRSAVALRQVLPSSIGMILAGTLRHAAWMVGISSPFIILSSPSFVSAAPSGFSSRFVTLPVRIFLWAARPDGIYRNNAAMIALILLFLILFLYLVAEIVRRNILRRREGLR